jgi:hypothetical protein
MAKSETIVSNTGNNTRQVSQQVAPQVEMLLKVLIGADKPLARNELQSRLSLKDRESFRERYLKPALEQGLIKMTIPGKPKQPLAAISSDGPWPTFGIDLAELINTLTGSNSSMRCWAKSEVFPG